MKLHQHQAEIASDNHRFRVLCCGRRFGKTTLAVEEIKGCALYKESRIAYIAPTYQQARDIAWQMLVRELKPIIKKVNESRLELEIVNKDEKSSYIFLRGWEAVETLRGQAFDFIVIDEVAMMRNFWLNWEEVIRPTLTDRKGQVMFISTPKGFNHFYDLYNKQDIDFKSFHYSTYDNPFIPKEEIDKAKEELPENRFEQEYMANFKKTEGLVYKEFERERHVTTEQPTSVAETLVGIDWGYTNPAGVLRIRVDRDNHYWIDSEYYQRGRTTEQIVDYAKSLKPTRVYPDPAEPDRIEIANRSGLNCLEVSKDIEAGIDSVVTLFKQNRIHIHPSCKNLILELETYHYPEKRPDQNEKETPVKENDHLMDCLRYVLHNQQPVIIGNLKTRY
jgi:PBSX family phage terminase large subunit